MHLSLRQPGRGREADLDLAARRDLDRLLAFLHSIKIEFDDATRGFGSLGADLALDLDRLALRDEVLGGSGRVDRDVVDLVRTQAKDEGGDLATGSRLGLGDPIETLGGLLGVPGRSRQVRQHVHLMTRPVALDDFRINLPHGGIQGPIHGADGQVVDPLAGRGRRQTVGRDGIGRVDGEDQAGVRNLVEDRQGPFLGLVEPGLVFLLVTHRQAGVEDQAQRGGDRLIAQRQLRIEPGPRQCQSHQSQYGHAGQEQQPVLDAEPLLRPLLPLAHQAQGRENDMLGRLPHEQVQNDRQCRERCSSRQSRVDHREFHTPSPPGLAAEQIGHQGFVEGHPRMQRNIIDAGRMQSAR